MGLFYSKWVKDQSQRTHQSQDRPPGDTEMVLNHCWLQWEKASEKAQLDQVLSSLHLIQKMEELRWQRMGRRRTVESQRYIQWTWILSRSVESWTSQDVHSELLLAKKAFCWLPTASWLVESTYSFQIPFITSTQEFLSVFLMKLVHIGLRPKVYSLKMLPLYFQIVLHLTYEYTKKTC